MPLGARGPARSGVGDLLVIGGAEDKLGRRTVLREFVRTGGRLPRPGSRWSRRRPRSARRSSRSTTRCSAGSAPQRSYAVRPEDRAQASVARARPASSTAATGIFMTGGNQLKLSTVIAGTPFGQAIIEARATRRHHRRDLRGREHPVLAHGGLRPRRVDPQAADDPGRRRARAGRELRDRPALRAAQPLRTTADDRRSEPAAARDGRRRGHRGGDHPHRRTPRCCASSAAVR